MIPAVAMLVGFALLGEVASRALHLPTPGPVTGLAALALWLWIGSRWPMAWLGAPRELVAVARVMIANLGVLFVPAGVGAVDQLGRLAPQGLAIAAALIGSTLASLWVTGGVMQLWLRSRPFTTDGPS